VSEESLALLDHKRRQLIKPALRSAA